MVRKCSMVTKSKMTTTKLTDDLLVLSHHFQRISYIVIEHVTWHYPTFHCYWIMKRSFTQLTKTHILSIHVPSTILSKNKVGIVLGATVYQSTFETLTSFVFVHILNTLSRVTHDYPLPPPLTLKRCFFKCCCGCIKYLLLGGFVPHPHYGWLGVSREPQILPISSDTSF